MHGTTRTRPAIHTAVSGVDAVVWIEPGRAIAVVGSPTGQADVIEVTLPETDAEIPAALAGLAHRIDGADRVIVLGTEDLRIALEREIVAIGHRPEVIREEATTVRLDAADLLARLRRLS